jgi:acyl-CoA synthetase (AMP-forming)/AMP-acid ligase II
VIPSQLTIPGALRAAVGRFGGREAVVDHHERITFAALAAGAERVARALMTSGVERGDRVAVWAPNSARWVVTSFGIYLAAGVLVPLNTRYKGREAGHILSRSDARLLLTTTDFLGTNYVDLLSGQPDLPIGETVVLDGKVPEQTTSWVDFLARAERTPPDAVTAREAAISPDDISDLIFTSGTTGAPKGAMLTHGASTRTYATWAELVGLREGDRYLLVYPLFHTAGLKSGVLACVLAGATVIPEPVFDVATVMQRVADEGITVFPGPPTVFQTILNDLNLGDHDLSTLRLSVTGAAVVPVELIRRMRDELGFENVVTGYGLTETTGTVSMCRHDDPPEVIARTVGRPLPGVEVRVVDEAGKDVERRQPGELLARGFNVMKGYFRDENATALAIDAEGWLRTGDIGFVDDDGNLRITDRKKDMFIVGGFNAYPAEIENMMLGHPDLAQVAVVGVPDERLGEVGVAFVVPKIGHAVDPDAVIDWCRERMANFKVPRGVKIARELPVNPSGKIMKFRLREQLLQTSQGSDP